jgi:hypothetical protein
MSYLLVKKLSLSFEAKLSMLFEVVAASTTATRIPSALATLTSTSSRAGRNAVTVHCSFIVIFKLIKGKRYQF